MPAAILKNDAILEWDSKWFLKKIKILQGTVYNDIDLFFELLHFRTSYKKSAWFKHDNFPTRIEIRHQESNWYLNLQ